MRVLFVNPPAFNELTTQVGKEITENSSFQPPLGLLYIASYLQKQGQHEIRVIDSQVDRLSYEELEAIITAWRPDIVGLTAMTFTMVDVMITASMVKKIDPAIAVCLGGPHVDIYAPETIRLDDVDFVIRKPGEASFALLIKELESDRRFERVPGLLYKDKNKDVHENPQAPASATLEELPFPDRTMLPYEKYYSIMTANRPVGTMVTAKGCPYMCVFCSERGSKPSWRSGKSVAAEMLEAKRIGIKEMFFVDDTFYVKKQASMEISQALIDLNVGMPWGARARVNNLDQGMLEMFRKSGCQRLHIGVEAGTDRVLKLLQKNITTDQARKAFKLCKGAGLNTMAYFIVGNPGETLEDVRATFRLACELEPTTVQFSRMTPMPATELYEMGLRSGQFPDYWREFARDPLGSVENGFRPKLWTENFSEEQLFELADQHTRSFYFRPRYMAKSILAVRSFHDFRRKARAARDLLRGTRQSTTRLQKLI
jgi:anaerobic magnesium-protoporphyrin IX monomethyl ester cyclase